MGNAALGEMLRPRPAVVEERLTRPQRLVRQLSDLDSGRLRRLIRSGDLAPCFDADDDERAVECPICFYVRTRDRSLPASRVALLCCALLMVFFLSSMFDTMQFYPSLNRSRCCSKGICTGELHFLLIPVDFFTKIQT
jgi:hypothetical protein